MPFSKFFRKIAKDIGEDFAASALRADKASDDQEFRFDHGNSDEGFGDFVIA
jgi:hypothetical protein